MTVNPRLNPATTGSSGMVQHENEETQEIQPTQQTEEIVPQQVTDGLNPLQEIQSTDKLEKDFKEIQITDSGIAVENEEEIDTSFPLDSLAKLDDMVNKPKWIIPVLPKHELEILLDASIRLSKLGIDTNNEACQRFIKEGLTISFNKILLDDAVSTWKFEIHKYIFKNTEKLLELCVLKLEDDCFPLLDLLAIAFNPNSRFHSYNSSRNAENNAIPQLINGEEKPPFARSCDHRQPKGWLVDLVNHFGNLGGFVKLKKRFCENGNLNVPIVCGLIRPFGYCAEILYEKTIEDFLIPVIHVIKSFLDSITDEVLKKESKTESKNEAITMIIKSMKSIVARLPGQDEFCKELEKLRLQMILRLLQVSPFNGKMNALNEINRVISSVSYHGHHRHTGYDDDEFLTHDMVAKWLQENQVLIIVLKDNLHQLQYVEKLEKIIRFALKTKTLTIQDLDTIWMAQIGKHEAIVKNVHDLLAKLAWDFSAEQLDTLFSRFQASWNTANKKQQEKLLELIRRLAEDDKEGVIAHKVLLLLWQLAHSHDLPTDIMDQALNAHIKILDYSCSQTQDRDSLKVQWINRCVDELRSGKWVIPALKSIKAICELFYEGCSTINNPHVIYRNQIVENIQQTHAVVSLVAEDLTNYMNNIRKIYEENTQVDPLKLQPDGRYSHVMQITERLDFLRFILNDGKMWLCQPQAEQIWICLAINSVFPVDKDVCFNWFSTVMGDDPDLDPEITRQFFEQNVLQIPPNTLNEAGLRCFERFFKYVNTKEGHLQKKRNGTFVLENTNLIGYNYLWRVIIESPSEIAHHGIEIIKEIYTNLGQSLKVHQHEIHEMFIRTCTEKFAPSEHILKNTEESLSKNKVSEEARKIMLCLKALREYVSESDCNYMEERAFPPHSKACRGRQICLYVRFSSQNRQLDDFEIWTHTNESIAMLRRRICHKLKSSSQQIKLDIYNNSELINTADDRKLVGDLEIKDRTLFTVKIGSVGGSVPSSPDSSSDSSPPPTPQQSSGPNIDKEIMLPGVILSRKKFASKLFSLGELAVKYEVYELRNIILSLLNLCPTDVDTIQQLKMACQDRATKGSKSKFSLESFYFGVSPLQVLYNLEVTYLLLLPALEMSNSSLSFQQDFVLAGGIDCVLNMFKESTFLQGSDPLIKRCAYTVLLKMSKFLFTTIAFAHISVIAEALQKDNAQEIAAFQERHSYALNLQQAIQQIPHHYYENIIRSYALKLGQSLNKHAIRFMPCNNVITVILKICWSAGIGDITLHQESYETIHSKYELEYFKQLEIEDSNLSKEAFEVLTITFALCPTTSENIIKDKFWKTFILDTLLSSNRQVRLTAADQFFLIVSKCSNGQLPLKFFIQLLFAVRDRNVLQHPHQASEYFNLLCRLLNYGRSIDLQLRNATSILEQEIKWLKDLEEKYLQNSGNVADLVVPELLEGHLGVTKELLSYHSIQKRYSIGCDPNGDKLLSSLLNNFVFSASKLAVVSENGGDFIVSQNVNPICTTSSCMIGALDLLVALATNCVQNFKMLSDYLTSLYYANSESSLADWEYQPPIGPRPSNGFVGLKNAGATCYMNSVLQQLYMIPEVRCGVLSSHIDYNEESIEEEEKMMQDLSICKEDEAIHSKERVERSQEEERKQYNLKILSQVQAIFGHLHSSKLQFHVPKGFWRSFRLFGEPVNVREQHDAYEFFNTLVDNIDEGLKASGFKTICENILGGSFADQKICKQCPHRYSRESPFTALSVDVRNHHNLIDSLEQYVKGDLLEGANAYHCERCNKKVDTVKRMCIKKLPKVLAIQLKRFEYDWERDCAVKFNDYFEFPREFNLEPFTVEGLAKLEGEVIEDDVSEEQLASGKINDICQEGKDKSTIYKLMGVVVHSGQASGGHYYSYIIPRTNNSAGKWYRFDDGDVCECNMDNDEELKNQCFGGDYMGEAFDHMLKRRQKRWWNAYLLFYERIDILSESKRDTLIPHGPDEMPLSIRCSVQKENLTFLHTRTQFSTEYFQFIRKLALSSLVQHQGSAQKAIDPVREELCLMSFQLLCKFLFTVGFHTKKNIRGPANEWYEAVSALIRQGPSLRRWFVVDVLLANPDHIIEYLLECPVGEIRTAFARIIVVLAHVTRSDGPVSIETFPYHLAPWQLIGLDMNKSTLSDYLLRTVLEVLHREGPDSMARHLLQYFHLFVMYAGIGIPERKQLLDLGVLTTLIRLAIEDDRGNSSKYQYAELTKLYTLVSVLIRSCDVSKYMKSAHEDEPPLANPFIDSQVSKAIMEIPADVEGLIYTSNYVKRLLEDGSSSDDTIHLIKFLSWECFSFSLIALSEVLLQISYAYAHEIRPFLDILLHMLVMNDSWQEQRLKCAFKGVSDDREGLFDTIHRSKNHNHKRGYQCIKAIVQLTQNSELALNFLMQHDDLKEKWKSAVRWLGDELERRAPSAYNYNNWSPPTQSNETSNGYFLERSHSARFTYRKACEMFREEQEEEDEEEDNSELMETLNQSPSTENVATDRNEGDGEERPTTYENTANNSDESQENLMKERNMTSIDSLLSKFTTEN